MEDPNFSLRKEVDYLKAKLEIATNTLRTISTFPISNPGTDQDAVNMVSLAKSALTRLAR